MHNKKQSAFSEFLLRPQSTQTQRAMRCLQHHRLAGPKKVIIFVDEKLLILSCVLLLDGGLFFVVLHDVGR